jgi:hypothetical protein
MSVAGIPGQVEPRGWGVCNLPIVGKPSCNLVTNCFINVSNYKLYQLYHSKQRMASHFCPTLTCGTSDIRSRAHANLTLNVVNVAFQVKLVATNACILYNQLLRNKLIHSIAR